ncbi:MAG TPA: hypothetical protein VGN33_02375 [Leifsonia sp.]|nr:hypothetical protein [Leifsonia sp.]
MISGRAAVLDAPGALVVADVEFGRPGPGEVLVKLVASGLCHTDLGVIAGGIPFGLPESSVTRERVSLRLSATG